LVDFLVTQPADQVAGRSLQPQRRLRRARV